MATEETGTTKKEDLQISVTAYCGSSWKLRKKKALVRRAAKVRALQCKAYTRRKN